MAEKTKQVGKKKQQPIYAGVGLILGSAVGYFLGMGDPVTAAMGAAVGLILGAAIDATSKQKKEGAK